MADLYLDPVSGSDNNGGDSWTVTATGTDGVTNGTTTFTSASASFTSALIGRYINIVTKGTYTISAVPNGTTLTLALISGGASNPTTGSSLTYNIGGACQTPGRGPTAVRINGPDRIKIAKSPDPTSLGNATWTNASRTITLATACTANVATC